MTVPYMVSLAADADTRLCTSLVFRSIVLTRFIWQSVLRHIPVDTTGLSSLRRRRLPHSTRREMAHLACPSTVAVNQDLRGQDDLWKLVTPHDLHAVGDGGSCPEGPTASTVPAYTRRPLVAFSRRDALWYVLIPRHRQVVDPMDIPPKEMRRKAAAFADHARRRRRPVIGCRTALVSFSAAQHSTASDACGRRIDRRLVGAQPSSQDASTFILRTK